MRLVGHDLFLDHHMIDAKKDYKRNETHLKSVITELEAKGQHQEAVDILKNNFRTEQENIDPKPIMEKIRSLI